MIRTRRLASPSLAPTPSPSPPAIRSGWLSAAAFSGMFGFGIVMALLGAVMPIVSVRLHFDLAQAGVLFLSMNAAMLATTLALGPLLDRFGMKPPLLAGPLLLAAALLLISRATAYGALAVAVVILGAGGAVLNSTTNTLVADLHEDARRKSAALNLLGVFFGIGALFIPFTIGALIGRIGIDAILYCAIALALVTTVLSVALRFPNPKQAGGLQVSEVAGLAGNRVVLALAFLLFFESGNEFILGGYISTYLTREAATPVAVASYVLAAYWAGIMAARIALSRLLLVFRNESLIALGAAGTVVGVALLLAARGPSMAFAAVVVIGLSLAAVFPTTLGIAAARFPTRSGSVFGILIAIALAGGMTLPWLVGQVAAASSLRLALIIAIFDGLGILVCLGLYQRASNQH